MTMAQPPATESQRQRFPTWGVVSLCLAVLSPIIPGPGFIYSLVAAVLGHIAYKKEPTKRVFAILAVVLGWLGVLFGLLFTFVVLPWLFTVLDDFARSFN